MRKLLAIAVAAAALAAPATAQGHYNHSPYVWYAYCGGTAANPGWLAYPYANCNSYVGELEAQVFVADTHNAIYDPVLRFGTITRINSSAVRVNARAKNSYHLRSCVVDWDSGGSSPGIDVTCTLLQ